jgi:hypothetical protein
VPDVTLPLREAMNSALRHLGYPQGDPMDLPPDAMFSTTLHFVVPVVRAGMAV